MTICEGPRILRPRWFPHRLHVASATAPSIYRRSRDFAHRYSDKAWTTRPGVRRLALPWRYTTNPSPVARELPDAALPRVGLALDPGGQYEQDTRGHHGDLDHHVLTARQVDVRPVVRPPVDATRANVRGRPDRRHVDDEPEGAGPDPDARPAHECQRALPAPTARLGRRGRRGHTPKVPRSARLEKICATGHAEACGASPAFAACDSRGGVPTSPSPAALAASQPRPRCRGKSGRMTPCPSPSRPSRPGPASRSRSPCRCGTLAEART